MTTSRTEEEGRGHATASKLCRGCNTIRRVADFNRDRRAKSGLQNNCKACAADYERKHPEAGKRRRNRYEAKHPARLIFRILRYRADDAPCMPRDAFVAWYISAEKTCVYCGISEAEAISRFAHRLHIDRKITNLGYVLDNICLACQRCNLVKNGYLTFEQMQIVARMFFRGKPTNSHYAMKEALEGTLRLIRSAQERLCLHLHPDSASDDGELLNVLLEMFDGPRQREIESRARAALELAGAKG